MRSYILCALSLLFFASSAHAANEITDRTTGISFPEHVTFIFNEKEYQLQATGVATRKKIIFDVYSIAHYLQDEIANGQDKIETILNDHFAKQLTIKWARDVPANKIQEGYQESFKNALSPSSYKTLQDTIDKFISFFDQDAKKGDEYILRWIPEGTIEVVLNGKQVGIIANKEFAVGLWNIWFGTHSIVDKDKLILLLHSPT